MTKVKSTGPAAPFFAISFAFSAGSSSIEAVPVNCEAEKVHRSFGPALPDASCVWNRDGVYYAMLTLEGQDAPMEVALHGVRTEIEARQALDSLGGRRGVVCSLAL